MDTVTHDGFTISSNQETAAEMRTQLELPEPDVAEAPAAQEQASAEPAAAEAESASEGTPAKAEGERNQDGTFKAKKPRNDPQARIDAITAKQREAERRADAAEARLAALTQKEQPTKPPVAAAPADASDPEPQEGEYDDYRKFVKAQARWEARQEIKAAQKVEREQREIEQRQSAERERATAWQTRLTDARAKTPDFDTRLNPDLPLSAPMRDVVLDSPVGPELLLYLSDHPDDAQRLSTLHPIQVIREMGKLEARVEAAHSGPASTPRAPMSQAKPPIKPVVGSPSVSDTPPGDDASDEEHEAYWGKRRAKYRGV